MLKDAERHLQVATQERSFYRSAIEASKEVLRTTFNVNGHLEVPPIGSSIKPLENDIEMHFSMDIAQQVEWTQLNSNLNYTKFLINKYTIPVIHNSQGLCISLHPTNMLSLGSAVRQYHDRWE